MSDFSEDHRCVHCGHRFGDHAGPRNPHCHPHGCPAGADFPRCHNDDEAAWDKAIARFWTMRTTVFKGTL